MKVAVHELDAPRWRIRAREAGDNCGTGAGGFQPGNTCGAGEGGGQASEKVKAWAEKRFKDPEKAKAFAEWFGDSRVVDEQGAPLRVFHGTKVDVPAFSIKKAGTSDPGLVGKGFYFAPGGDQAGEFATSQHYGKGDAPNVLPVYVSIKNPFIITDGQLPDGRGLSAVHPHGITKDSAQALKTFITSSGHDGAIFRTAAGEVTQVVVFKPEQIKSTFNRGTFNPKSPKLSESTADPITPNRTITTAADATRAAQDLLCDKASAELVPDIAACVNAFLTDARRWFLACDGDCWSPESARRAGIGGAVNQGAARLHTAIMERLVRAIGSTRVDAFTQGIAATRVSSAACVPERVTTGQVVVLREAFDPNQPRADDGKWTDGAGGSGTAAEKRERERFGYKRRERDGHASDKDEAEGRARAARDLQSVGIAATEANVMIDAVKDYTATSDINRSLAAVGPFASIPTAAELSDAGLDADTVTTVDRIDKFLAASPKYVGAQLFRGITLSGADAARLSPGASLEWAAFSSTTSSQRLAEKFSSWGLPDSATDPVPGATAVMLRISRPRTGVSVNHIALGTYTGTPEEEVLFPRGTRFSIDKIERTTGTVYDNYKFDMMMVDVHEA